MRCFYQNVAGYNSKINTFYKNISVYDFDIICLTESWLIDGVSSSELFSSHYIIFRSDLQETRLTKGGKVLCAVNNF